MVNIESILKKLSSLTKNEVPILTSFLSLSLSELKQQTQNLLSKNELNILYTAVQDARKESIVFNSRLLGRVNPQLSSIIQRLNIDLLAQTKDYNEWFPGRTDRFVGSESVASMFSPAAYLTELYREGLELHPDTSIYHLLNRRPDLATLILTQQNMDREVSTLNLSNELLINNIQNLLNKTYNEILEMLSTYRLTGVTPYHLPYEAARQSILLQDPDFTAFTDNYDVAKLMDPVSLLAISVDISPELYEILIEDIADKNVNELIQKNFGDIDVSSFLEYSNLIQYYQLTNEKLEFLVNLSDKQLQEELSYKNDQLITLMNTDTGIYVVEIERKYIDNSYQMNYCDLIPLNKNDYLCNFSFKTGHVAALKIGTRATGSQFYQTNNSFKLNEKISVPIILTDKQLKDGVFIGFTRYSSNDFTGGYFYASVSFTFWIFNQSIFLLQLNKLIRLYKTTLISMQDIEQTMHSVYPNEFLIDVEVLSKLFYVLHYKRQYLVDIDDALVLANVDISQSKANQQPSQFTCLFNTPLLNGQEFSVDNNVLELTPGVSGDYFRLGILKRAFQLNDTELDNLWKLVNGGKKVDFVCSIKNLSTLYRFNLLAKLHELTVYELSLLISISPYSEQVLVDLSDDEEIAQLIAFLAQYTKWMRLQQWSVNDVYLMLTEEFSRVLTPDIENLISTLQAGQMNDEWTNDVLIVAAAPLMAATLQLDSTETTIALLYWINQLQPAGLEFINFIHLVNSEIRTETEIEKLVTYCQVLAQLVLIVRNIGLSNGELNLVVTKPDRFIKGQKFLPQDILTLYTLTHFHAWIMRCGSYATEILAALQQGKLSAELLAIALELDTQTVKQALQQATSNENIFSDWATVNVVLQWIDVAEKLNITPSGVAMLLKMNYVSQVNKTSFNDWLSVSVLLQTGLNSQQTAQLHASLDETSSVAITAYYLKNFAPADITTPNELYQYFLIDNQVSAQVKTTPIAEAIASIQLYVNRAINELEEGSLKAILSRQFFQEWERYNKRYSTWAGVSLLVYYPENYVDPTLRIGQTPMVDDLLQQISQNQLHKDTVEEAFRNYLTAFEEIANLTIINAHHDYAIFDQGFTYFLAYSQTDPIRYYWRRLDSSKRNNDGRFPANAWSEWKEIVSAIQPYQNFIRPIIHYSRLSLIWIEQQIQKSDDAKTDIIYYYVKLTYLRYDGSWASPYTLDVQVTDYLKALGSGLSLTSEQIGWHCGAAYDYEIKGSFILFFYNKVSDTKYAGCYILPDMSIKAIPGGTLNRLNKNYGSDLEIPVGSVKVSGPVGEFYDIDLVPSIVTQSSDFTLETSLKVNYSVSYTNNIDIKFNVVPKFRIIYHNSTFEKISAKEISFKVERTKILATANGQDNCAGPEIKDNSESYQFDSILCVFSFTTNYVGNAKFVSVDASYSIVRNEKVLAQNTCEVVFLRNHLGGLNVPIITDKDNQAQYLELIPYRIRLNTLFAKQLIERAAWNIDVLFTLETQNLVEPQLGRGNYLRFLLPAYSQDIHGSSSQGNITIEDAYSKLTFVLWQGSLRNKTQIITRFLPISTNFGYSFDPKVYYNAIQIGTIKHARDNNNDPIYTGYITVDSVVQGWLLTDYDEPMDFQGANALYFWEMFFYTPMMIFQRLLQEGNFIEAKRWLEYVWNPAGYVIDDELNDIYWNMRPLAESLSWNANPLDEVDPDAVAQNDPMHYKVYVFMRYLDWLLAQCDAAYINYTLESMNEAKMWCIQAFNVLGEEPYVLQDSYWTEPRLDAAANLVSYTSYQSLLYQLREGIEVAKTSRTANSLTALFLPQFNAKLQSYWQIFKQRLYNLRHHLTIDGQPLSLTIYAAPANPAALLTAAVVTAQGSNALPQAIMPLYRFWVILEIAKSAIAQLIQFGTSFQNIIEKQDAETLSELLQTQGGALVLQSIKVQEQTIQEIEADQTVLQERLKGAQARFDSWSDRYEENINRGEEKAMDLYFGSSVTSTTGKALYMSAAALDLAPNIYGFAVGGSRYGALFNATGIGVEIAASATRIAADKISQSEIYRRRREEWESQRNNTEYEIKEIEAQLDSLTIRHEAAKLQKEYLEIQQSQTQEQLELLQSKFTNKSLYNWLRGKLSAIYYQYYIQVVSRCLMAEQAYCYEQNEKAASFIKPGAWQGTYGGLLAGETLLLNLAQMEKAYLEKDERALEVSRTVSFAEVYANLEKDYAFNFSEKVQIFLTSSSPQVGNDRNNLSLNKQNSLIAMVNLADLKIREDYPAELGAVRRIKQVSVTLPALVGPYQDVQAMLSYGGSVSMPRGCRAIAISQGMNDSGQFVLDFNDGKYLPFEGIPIDDESSLNITFPQAKDKQADLLKSLTDIILHIRYTIRS